MLTTTLLPCHKKCIFLRSRTGFFFFVWFLFVYLFYTLLKIRSWQNYPSLKNILSINFQGRRIPLATRHTFSLGLTRDLALACLCYTASPPLPKSQAIALSLLPYSPTCSLRFFLPHQRVSQIKV